MTQARRNAMVMEQRVRAAEQQQQQRNGGDVVMQDAATNGNTPHPNVDPQLLREAQSAKNQQRPGSEHIDEVVQILKTAFPLLILSMESMVEQLNSRFKASQDENTYRFISMLLQEALQVRTRGMSTGAYIDIWHAELRDQGQPDAGRARHPPRDLGHHATRAPRHSGGLPCTYHSISFTQLLTKFIGRL